MIRFFLGIILACAAVWAVFLTLGMVAMVHNANPPAVNHPVRHNR